MLETGIGQWSGGVLGEENKISNVVHEMQNFEVENAEDDFPGF